MSVFLRWGVFGILGVAALLYAYNASKRLTEVRAARPIPTASVPQEAPQVATRATAAEEAATRAPAAPAPPHPPTPQCEAELVVAQRAIEMRKQGAPLDRVLRIQEIAWQEPAERRQRLESVATRWFGYEGDFRPATLRIAVIADCEQHSPPP